MNNSAVPFRLYFPLLIFCFIVVMPLWGQVPPIIPIIDNPPIEIDKPITVTAEDVDNIKASGEQEKKVREELEKERKTREKEEEKKDIMALKRQNELPEAKIWGQQFFRNQSISLFTRSRDIKAIDSYLLGVGDEILITVWGAVDFSKSVSINQDGFIDLSIPDLMIPRLYVKGMKFGNMRKAVYQRLSKHMNMRSSFFDIQLNYSRSITINITGEVFNPGSYTIPAINTAFNALVAAGGPSQIGSVRKIKVVSASSESRTLDVYKFATNPNIAEDFFLFNNDYIFVPLAERVVEIKGSIKRPYFYELVEDEQLKEALVFAGGIEADAYLRNIQIKRYVNDQEKIIDLNLGQMLANEENFELLNGDIVNVSPIKEAYNNFVTIQGAVKLPGEYELRRDTRIREVLEKSGIMLSAVENRIYIKRLKPDFTIAYINVDVDSIMADANHPDNISLRAFDDIEVKFKSNFVDNYEISLAGAVRKPGQYVHSDSLTLADLIYMANGLKNESANSLIEISRLMHKDDGTTYSIVEQFEIDDSLNVAGAEDYLLRPHDQVFIRLARGFELPQNVTISGEVFYPGQYTLKKKGERILDLIQRAGGVTEIAFLEGAKLTRPGEGFVIIRLDNVLDDSTSRFNYLLKAGDRLVIPKPKDLVGIAGRINHPKIKDGSLIEDIRLKVELKKIQDDLEREEVLAEKKIQELTNPRKINAPFHSGKRANYYLKEYAGGIDRKNGGRRRLVYVRYPSGAVKKTRGFLFFKKFPKVEKGALVYVDTKSKREKADKDPNARKPVDWTKVLSDTLALMASSLTTVGLILALRSRNNP